MRARMALRAVLLVHCALAGELAAAAAAEHLRHSNGTVGPIANPPRVGRIVNPSYNRPVLLGPLRLLPYPQQIEFVSGRLPLGPAEYVAGRNPSQTERVARESLERYLPHQGKAVPVRLGSVEEGYPAEWLLPKDRQFLASPKTSPEGSVVSISGKGITVVGKGKWGMLYGVQTINQLIRGTDTSQGVWKMNTSLPCLTIRDWPDLRWRCLSPQMTWYSGYNRLEGYDNGNWTLDEWKWLVDWSLLHKCNGWALCMYGNWPFTLPGYEETTLDVDSFFYNPRTGKKEPHRFTHRNIKKEFLPELIRYANQRGVKIYAYIGKNTFNGTYGLKHPDANAGGAAELIPFHPGVHEYWDAFIRRIIEIGFNGFVFEDPEAMHVPNQNAACYKTFWEPWAKTYGFKSVAETDQNHPPLGVQVEYYCWLFKVFDAMIRKHAATGLHVDRSLQDRIPRLGETRPRGGRPQEIYLISHVLLSRVVSESKTQAERDKWFATIDQKQGRKAPFIILEADERKYVSFLGRDRVASLGGRGGSCTNAMRRIASINNNWTGGGMGGDLAYERQCQKRIYEAGGFGAMGYIFEWTNTEVFGYLAAQYLWRNAGVPGINNENQTGFLDYAYRMHYGDEVGKLVARIMDEGSCVNDAMMLDGVYGSQYPSTGAPLHRDYQYLAVLADRAVDLARKAFQLYTGREPDLYRPVYRPEDFRWDGFDQQANKTFNAERLRLLYVSTRRSQKMCEAVLAHRMAQRLIAEGAPAGKVLALFDRAIEAAKANQLIYQLNYDDDYDWTDGLCARVTEALQSQRDRFIASIRVLRIPEAVTLSQADLARAVPDSVRRSVSNAFFIPWEKQSDIVPEAHPATKPGLYLSTDIGCDTRYDFYRLGAVFTVQAQRPDGTWRTIFRKDVPRRATGWEHWDIPLSRGPVSPRPDSASRSDAATWKLRFKTDSYSRAQDRSAPSWKWALWGEPQLVEVAPDGSRRVKYDFIQNIDRAKRFVRLDRDGKERRFDGQGQDSTGATFKYADPGVIHEYRDVAEATADASIPRPRKPAIAAFTPHLDGKFGVTIAEYTATVSRAAGRKIGRGAE